MLRELESGRERGGAANGASVSPPGAAANAPLTLATAPPAVVRGRLRPPQPLTVRLTHAQPSSWLDRGVHFEADQRAAWGSGVELDAPSERLDPTVDLSDGEELELAALSAPARGASTYTVEEALQFEADEMRALIAHYRCEQMRVRSAVATFYAHALGRADPRALAEEPPPPLRLPSTSEGTMDAFDPISPLIPSPVSSRVRRVRQYAPSRPLPPLHRCRSARRRRSAPRARVQRRTGGAVSFLIDPLHFSANPIWGLPY